MAQKVQVLLVDDLDGSEATETVSFGLDGVAYEIDLSSGNAGQLRTELAQPLLTLAWSVLVLGERLPPAAPVAAAAVIACIAVTQRTQGASASRVSGPGTRRASRGRTRARARRSRTPRKLTFHNICDFI